MFADHASRPSSGSISGLGSLTDDWLASDTPDENLVSGGVVEMRGVAETARP